jgi:UDP-N-acetylenolpyruvoylglucosamine reductase
VTNVKSAKEGLSALGAHIGIPGLAGGALEAV